MTQSSLARPCAHLATPQEQQRDPDYLTCNAQPGEPCRWAKRYDGVSNPAFHAERFEPAHAPQPTDPHDLRVFEQAVLASGLI